MDVMRCNTKLSFPRFLWSSYSAGAFGHKIRTAFPRGLCKFALTKADFSSIAEGLWLKKISWLDKFFCRVNVVQVFQFSITLQLLPINVQLSSFKDRLEPWTGRSDGITECEDWTINLGFIIAIEFFGSLVVSLMFLITSRRIWNGGL